MQPMNFLGRSLATLLVLLAAVGVAYSGDDLPLIGDCEQVFTLSNKTRDVRGLAVDATVVGSPRLLILDRTAKIFV